MYGVSYTVVVRIRWCIYNSVCTVAVRLRQCMYSGGTCAVMCVHGGASH